MLVAIKKKKFFLEQTNLSLIHQICMKSVQKFRRVIISQLSLVKQSIHRVYIQCIFRTGVWIFRNVCENFLAPFEDEKKKNLFRYA